ncbi:MAG TPA: sulfatase-like hydrolase/transferase, partial [Candidatus Saccharimonadales bacterium]|nr:sulfatase-like hydrolase/transferase [Candidatus Saccharimonadales bacterium]
GVTVALAAAACLVSQTRDRASGPLPAAAPGKPSIVLIVLDTVRADHLHRFGYARDTMPALEAWARDALTVERAVTPGGWTSPSHASIFTGLSVSEHGVHYAEDPGGDDEHLGTLPVEGLPWITNRLSALGYRCIAVSANSLAIPHEMTGWSRHVEPRRILWLPSTLAGLGDIVSPLSRRISEALRWRMPYAEASDVVDITMRAVPPQGGPLFLFVNMMDAHSPYNPPAAALRSLDVDPRPPFGLYATHRDITREWKDLPPGTGEALADLYDGELRSMDMELRRLLPWIDGRFGKNALVIVASDHGEELGEKGRVGHEYGLSQRILHVPLFVKGDGVRSGDDNEVASLVNLYDYILAAASGGTPDEAILSQAGKHGILSERYPSGYNAAKLGPAYGRAWVSLIEDDLKVVGPPDEGLKLYDLGKEGFSSEVPLAMTPEAALLGGRIADYWDALRDQRTGDEGRAAESKERLRRLKALGYVE